MVKFLKWGYSCSFSLTERFKRFDRGDGNIIVNNINNIKNTIHDEVYTHSNGIKNNLLNWESKTGVEWLISKNADGSYIIQNRANGCLLADDGAKVNWSQIGGISTYWEIIPV